MTWRLLSSIMICDSCILWNSNNCHVGLDWIHYNISTTPMTTLGPKNRAINSALIDLQAFIEPSGCLGSGSDCLSSNSAKYYRWSSALTIESICRLYAEVKFINSTEPKFFRKGKTCLWSNNQKLKFMDFPVWDRLEKKEKLYLIKLDWIWNSNRRSRRIFLKRRFLGFQKLINGAMPISQLQQFSQRDLDDLRRITSTQK